MAEVVRMVSFGTYDESDLGLLKELAFMDGFGALTRTGQAFEDAYWVYDDEETAVGLWREGLLRLPATQALVQGLHGRGPVPAAGAHHLLVRHRLAEADAEQATRSFLQRLNKAGIVAYSNKTQKVRILVPAAEEVAPKVRVIEPARPYSNVYGLRETLRACKGHIHWAEPHLSRKVLEVLAPEADAERIQEIRLLSNDGVVDEATMGDFKRFRSEMEDRGITAEWRVIPKKGMPFHDRFILGANKVWNVPPLNTLLKGDYSEILETPNRPPFLDWWERGTPLAG